MYRILYTDYAAADVLVLAEAADSVPLTLADSGARLASAMLADSDVLALAGSDTLVLAGSDTLVLAGSDVLVLAGSDTLVLAGSEAGALDEESVPQATRDNAITAQTAKISAFFI